MSELTDALIVELKSLAPDARERLCRQFHRELFAPEFTKPSQIEPPETWLRLMAEPDANPQLDLILALPAGSQTGPVLGGVVIEHYRESQCSLVTYMVMSEQHRGRGLGRRLLDTALAQARSFSKSDGCPIVFAEVEKTIEDQLDHREVQTRRLTLSSLGFARVALDYVQPALSPAQQPDSNLDLLVWTDPEKGPPALPRATLIKFLTEFYTVNGQANSAALAAMLESVPQDARLEPTDLVADMPEAHQRVLGEAKDISVRFIFISSPVNESGGRVSFVRNDIPAQAVRPMESFLNDIMLPYTTRASLPVIALCEPPDGDEEGKPPGGHPIMIHLPKTLTAAWEGRDVSLAFGEHGLEIPCRLLDVMAVFADGTLGYSPSFVFDHAHSPLASDGENGGLQISAPALLALMSLVEKAEDEAAADSPRHALRFTASWTDNAVPLDKFVSQRLATLLQPDRRDTVFSKFLHPDGKSRAVAPDRQTAASDILRNGWDDLATVAVEINGGAQFQRFRHLVEESRHKSVPATPFNKQLAALAENVFDYHEQDADEIADSLRHGVAEAGYVALASSDSTIFLTLNSRTYSQMRDVAGGCPYFLLTVTALAYNQHLVERGAEIVEEIRTHIRRNTRNAEFDRRLGGKYFAQSRESLRLRYRFLHEFRSNFLPNIFRYDTEKNLFEAISKMRGIDRRFEAFDKLLEELDAFQRDVQNLIRESIDAWLAFALFALGIWQLVGVLGAFWNEAEKSYVRGEVPTITSIGSVFLWSTGILTLIAIFASIRVLDRYLRGRS